MSTLKLIRKKKTMGKKKATKQIQADWKKLNASTRACKAMLGDMLEAARTDKSYTFRKTKVQEKLVRDLTKALGACYIEAEERRDEFWLGVRTLDGVPADAALSYDDKTNTITWGDNKKDK